MREIVNPALIAAMIIVVPLAVAMLGAIWTEARTSRRDRADGVVSPGRDCDSPERN